MKKHICEPILVSTREDGMPYECIECGKGFSDSNLNNGENNQ